MKRRELSNEYLSSFCIELSMLLQAGFAPYDSVMMLYDDEPSDDGRIVLKSLIDSLEKGLPFSAVIRESGYFPQYLIIMSEAGEKTGRLTEALKALSEHYNRQERLSEAIRNAVFYPLVLFVLMIAVVLIIIIRVLPVFSSVFNRFGTQLPPVAVSLMRFGGWLADFFVVIVAFFTVLIIIAIIMWLSVTVRESVKKVFDNAFSDKGVFQRITASRIISVVALATASGIDPENAIELAISAGGSSKAVVKRHDLYLEALRSGGSFSEALLKAGFLSARDARMLSVGSRSGMADATLVEIAARCERDTQAEIDKIVKVIEPALVIVSSVVVGSILIMVMVPLIGIMSSIG